MIKMVFELVLLDQVNFTSGEHTGEQIILKTKKCYIHSLLRHLSSDASEMAFTGLKVG